MPFANPAPTHARIRVGGSLYGDARWSIGLNWGSPSGGDPFSNANPGIPAGLQAWANAVRALNNRNVLSGVLLNTIGTGGTVDNIRCSRIGPDGLESDVAIVAINPVIGGTGDATLPAQLAVAVSLGTARPGASYRGRVYLPATGLPCTNGRLPAAAAQELATAFLAWMQQVSGAAGSLGGFLAETLTPVVASNTKGVLTPVTSVRVGNRFDSQRRRSEGEKEIYSVAAVAQ